MVRNLGELGPNLQKIVTRLLNNEDLLKLLYYTDKDPLRNPALTKEQISSEVFEKLIRVVPRVGAVTTANSFITLTVMGGRGNRENDQFRDIELRFEVFVPMTQWIIKDENLRPYCIIGEINKSIGGKTINNFGRITGGDFSLELLTDEMSCYSITYDITQYD